MKKITVALLLATSCIPAVATAHEAGEFFIRAGTATVRPTESSDNVMNLGEFKVSNDTQMGLTFTYMATENVGIELLAATPFRHKVGLDATGNLATVRQLPPTLMAQWYFCDAKSKVRPYVGAGINYTTFYDADFNSTGERNELSDLSVKDSWGVAGQVGLDYIVNDDWLINMSLWYIDIDTEVKFNNVNGERQNIKTNIDPFVFMFSAGYRF